MSDTRHILKTGKRGRPFAKDTHDLFATLIASLELETHTRFFRSYPYTFTTDDAAHNLANLRFSQSNRQPDPNDPSHIVTTTTTTTFSMNREVAKTICQYFMDARLIASSLDPSSHAFKDRGIYCVTPKGLHILERFITKNGIASDKLVGLFASLPICPKLLNLERRPADDEIYLTALVTDLVFRRFAGSSRPNYAQDPVSTLPNPPSQRPFQDNPKLPDGFDRSNGVELQDIIEKAPRNDRSGSPPSSSSSSTNNSSNPNSSSSSANSPYILYRMVFHSQAAVEWLSDYSTVQCRDEAAEILAHFVAARLITLHADRSRAGDRVTRTIAALDPKTASAAPTDRAEFNFGPRILYRITDKGRRLLETSASSSTSAAAASASALVVSRTEKARSDDAAAAAAAMNSSHHHLSSANSNSSDIDDHRSSTYVGNAALSDAVDSHLTHSNAASLHEFLRSQDWSKETHSSSARLRAILDEPALRALFRDYLRSNYCEENLGFWLDVSDFRRRFATTSSSSAGPNNASTTTTTTNPPSSHNANNHQPHKSSNANNSSSSASSHHNNNNNPSSAEIDSSQNAMEEHQKYLVNAAMTIYNTYLAPLSPNELNIDHNLRADVINFIAKVEGDAIAKPNSSKIPGAGPTAAAAAAPVYNANRTTNFKATQVQTLLRYYERIQAHIFRLLATDQVPRFVRTPKFLELVEQHTKDASSSLDSYSSKSLTG